ncbi:hypothetical protein ABFT23_19605 [Nocardioides sp. C4-1]|uniref:hypothetical protein n=1 Tax=Nocardioides sp. C4-1 TaxID=3151851 RepID=UPI003264DEA6
MGNPRWSAAAAIVLVGMALSACGGSDDGGGDDGAPSTAATDLAGGVDDATSGDTDLDGEADAGAELTPEAFCGFLAETAPDVVGLQPAEFAAAQFGTQLVAFYADEGLLTDIDGADMDALAAEGCPEAAADLLPALGASSFADPYAS